VLEIGLETFAREAKAILQDRRVGLVTHAAAVAPDFTHALDVLLQTNVRVTALFGPEHGLDGAGADATAIGDANDAHTGLPVYSLYGASKEPTPLMLERVDVLVFDMQDVGARFYTFLSTLAYVMHAAARAGKEIIVLDRPDPINGAQLEGPPSARDSSPLSVTSLSPSVTV
jgi:beta-N-acetylhexosaminidase